MKILIAEDDPTSRLLLLNILKKGGHEVLVTENGQAAWDELQKPDAPQIAVLDIMMPGMDGLELCRGLRSSSRQGYTYIILQTAKGAQNDIEAGFAAGADDYLVKPLDSLELQQRIRVAERILAYEEQLFENRAELKQYADEMEALAEERAKQLVHADRMATLGVLSAGIAHELNNPAAFVAGNVQTMQRAWSIVSKELQKAEQNPKLDFVYEEFPKMMHDMRNGVARISKIVGGLKSYARQDKPDCRPFFVGGALQEALILCRNALKYNVTVQKCLPDALPKVLGDKNKIEQVFINLITNAADAVAGQEHGVLIISGVHEGSHVRLKIQDTGQGLREDVLDRLFDPFFTTKPEGKGTGLGLSISKGIIEEHGGVLSACNRPEGGAEFSFDLPVAEKTI